MRSRCLAACPLTERTLSLFAGKWRLPLQDLACAPAEGKRWRIFRWNCQIRGAPSSHPFVLYCSLIPRAEQDVTDFFTRHFSGFISARF
jgi:hypothetical protein